MAFLFFYVRAKLPITPFVKKRVHFYFYISNSFTNQ